jgi:hypothetical protein
MQLQSQMQNKNVENSWGNNRSVSRQQPHSMQQDHSSPMGYGNNPNHPSHSTLMVGNNGSNRGEFIETRSGLSPEKINAKAKQQEYARVLQEQMREHEEVKKAEKLMGTSLATQPYGRSQSNPRGNDVGNRFSAAEGNFNKQFNNSHVESKTYSNGPYDGPTQNNIPFQAGSATQTRSMSTPRGGQNTQPQHGLMGQIGSAEERKQQQKLQMQQEYAKLLQMDQQLKSTPSKEIKGTMDSSPNHQGLNHGYSSNPMQSSNVPFPNRNSDYSQGYHNTQEKSQQSNYGYQQQRSPSRGHPSSSSLVLGEDSNNFQMQKMQLKDAKRQQQAEYAAFLEQQMVNKQKQKEEELKAIQSPPPKIQPTNQVPTLNINTGGSGSGNTPTPGKKKKTDVTSYNLPSNIPLEEGYELGPLGVPVRKTINVGDRNKQKQYYDQVAKNSPQKPNVNQNSQFQPDSPSKASQNRYEAPSNFGTEKLDSGNPYYNDYGPPGRGTPGPGPSNYNQPHYNDSSYDGPGQRGYDEYSKVPVYHEMNQNMRNLSERPHEQMHYEENPMRRGGRDPEGSNNSFMRGIPPQGEHEKKALQAQYLNEQVEGRRNTNDPKMPQQQQTNARSTNVDEDYKHIPDWSKNEKSLKKREEARRYQEEQAQIQAQQKQQEDALQRAKQSAIKQKETAFEAKRNPPNSYSRVAEADVRDSTATVDSYNNRGEPSQQRQQGSSVKPPPKVNHNDRRNEEYRGSEEEFYREQQRFAAPSQNSYETPQIRSNMQNPNPNHSRDFPEDGRRRQMDGRGEDHPSGGARRKWHAGDPGEQQQLLRAMVNLNSYFSK